MYMLQEGSIYLKDYQLLSQMNKYLCYVDLLAGNIPEIPSAGP